jgi:LmbE family N-acetylglucosaminyl deacetylase
MNFKKVLVLAPHTDDGELGAGGFISKLISEGADVTYVAFSTANESVAAHLPNDILAREVVEATEILGISGANRIVFDFPVRKFSYLRQEILESLIQIRQSKNFDLVLLPSVKDVHQDHGVIAAEGVRAFKGTSILSYELIWNNLEFSNNCFVPIDQNQLDMKISALQSYVSQSHRAYMQADFIRSLARTRGVQIGVDYAECFEVVRWVIK